MLELKFDTTEVEHFGAILGMVKDPQDRSLPEHLAALVQTAVDRDSSQCDSEMNTYITDLRKIERSIKGRFNRGSFKDEEARRRSELSLEYIRGAIDMGRLFLRGFRTDNSVGLLILQQRMRADKTIKSEEAEPKITQIKTA